MSEPKQIREGSMERHSSYRSLACTTEVSKSTLGWSAKALRRLQHLDHRRVAQDQAQFRVRLDGRQERLDYALHGETGVDEDRQVRLRRHPEQAHHLGVVELELLGDGMQLEAHETPLDAPRNSLS